MTELQQLPKFEDWLAKNTDEISEMIEFTKTYLDPSPDMLNRAGAEINQKAAVAGYLLADAEAYLISAKSHALNDMDSELGPTAQKVYMEEKTQDVRRLRDSLKVLCRSLKSLGIAVCSVRKAGR